MKTGRLVILMAEDEEHDVFFVRHALGKLGAQHQLHAVQNGEEAIAYLQGKGEYADRNRFPMPNIILCDLKMPRMDGFEFLHWLRTHPECMIIPTMVYTSSSQDADVRKAYTLGANAYLTKPNNLEQMTEFLRSTAEFWCRCELPPVMPRC